MSKPKTKKPLKPNKTSTPPSAGPSPQEINTLLALFTEQRYPEAADLAKTMTVRFPLHGFGWKALGAVLEQMERSADALSPLKKAVALSPDAPDAHNTLGNTLKNLGQLNKAEASYKRALKIKPDFVEAHSNLGIVLMEQGRLNEAKASYLRALEINPNFAEAHYNLGNIFTNLACLDEAEASYRRALKLNPNFVEVHYNLALLLNEQDKPMMALDIIKQTLKIKETEQAKSIFVACAKRLRYTQDDSEIRTLVVRALTEPWGHPSDLMRIGTDLVKLDPVISKCLALTAEAWPRRLSTQDLFGSNSLTTLTSDPLLHALLGSAPICDIEMERFLTMARHSLLEAASEATASDAEVDAALSFYTALTRQCFINEYVFSLTGDEIQKAGHLRDSLVAALAAQTQVPALWPVAVASYFPLYTLPLAARLCATHWPEAIEAVLVQQIREPEEELQLRPTIPRLTPIEDEVSLLVQNQYEENPYPRWVKTAPTEKAMNIPFASFRRHNTNATISVLIAGCGTGQHSIGTAQRLQGAQVLAVDLSISSLSYAKRKTRELGLTSIEYAQADLLKLNSLGRSFDVIESVGVLHHLADPWAGWQALLSLLRPGGVMKLGFYSEQARRNIIRIRKLIAEQGYGSTASEIRRCRQDLVDLDKNADFGTTLKSSDFFSISACRDLLFHVQEHRMTLTGIDAFLQNNNLIFLGFDIARHVLLAYKLRFPNDRAATNLSQWQIFENENPDTFFGMYQFWVQKADKSPKKYKP